MALSVVNNASSLNAQQNLGRTSSSLSKSLERLSTGLKINRGADGPAGLVISEQQRAQISGLRTAIDNANKAVSLVQTAEGALNEINTLLNKARSLALDSANSGVNEASALAANQAEITNALATINNIANNTKFGSSKFLLNGQGGIVGTATVNPSGLGQISAGSAAPTGAQTVAVGALGGGFVTGGAALAGTALSGAVFTSTGNLDETTPPGAGATLTISGAGLSSSVVVDLSAVTTAAGTVTAVQNALNTAAGAGQFTVSGSNTNPLVITANNSNAAITVASSNAATATFTGVATAGQTSLAGTTTLTVSGGGLASSVVVDLSAASVTDSTSTIAAIQSALDARTGAGNFVVDTSAGALRITSKISTTAVTAQSGNAATATATGVSTTAVVGTAGSAISSTTVANGNATGARVLGAANLSTGTLTQAGTLTIGGGGLTSPLVVNLNSGDGAAAIVTKVQQALDAATAIGGGSGKFTVSGTAGTGALTIQSNILGSAALSVKADSAATTAVTGVTNTGTGDAGTAGNALRVFVGAAEATVSTGSQGLTNFVTFGGSEGLSFNVLVNGGKATGGSNTVNITDNSLSFQIGANAGEFSKVSINKVTADSLGTGVSGLNNIATTDLGRIDVTTSNGAQDAIKVIDQAIADVSTIRAKLGAFQTNNLESIANSLRNTLENTISAESVIRDTDFASEIATFTRLQTQQQAGATVLGNANQTTQLVAQLLRG